MAAKKMTALAKKMKKQAGNWPCRYCEHMVQVSRPGAKYIGACEFRLMPGPRGGCKQFTLAKCFR